MILHVDISGLITEFRIRGLDQRKIDSALKCLVHVYSTQDLVNAENGGVLVKDVLDSYPLEVTQVASELYLERFTLWGLDVFRVKWGYDSAARSASRRLWDASSSPWEKFADGLDKRCLGLLLPESYEEGRVLESWKNNSKAEWLAGEVGGLDSKALSIVNDCMKVGYSLDLAFSCSSFLAGSGGSFDIAAKECLRFTEREGRTTPSSTVARDEIMEILLAVRPRSVRYGEADETVRLDLGRRTRTSERVLSNGIDDPLP